MKTTDAIRDLEAERAALVTRALTERRRLTADEAIRLSRLHDMLRDAEIEQIESAVAEKE
jgi:plasmid maintenance system antidote protein VapI